MDDPRSNPDVAFLLDLLTLLPRGGQAVGGFWQEFAEARGGYDLSSYAINLHAMRRRIEAGEGTLQDVHDLAQYCLMFFDLDELESNPAALELLGKNVRMGYATWCSPSALGLRLARSIFDRAWNIYVPIRADINRRTD